MTPLELREELAANREVAQRAIDLIEDLKRRFANRPPDVHETAAMALYVGDLYDVVENTLVRFVKFFGKAVPSGENWHRKLLDMFASGSMPPLPTLMDDRLRGRLDELRSFRHVVRVNYAFTLDWARIAPLVAIGPQALVEFLENAQAHA